MDTPHESKTVDFAGAPAWAYPIRFLIGHEIETDTIKDVPVAVTCRPLCNSNITFDQRIDARALSFGVAGKLCASDLIMYDHETESRDQQAIGKGIACETTG